MPSEVGQQTQQDPASAGREVVLARSAAAQLAAGLPYKSPQEIVEDLLQRLGNKRTMRDRKGLNHWEQYCPQYLERLVARHKVGEPLRQVVRFIIVNHSSAVEFGTRITCDADMAQTAVSRTYIELLKGGTTITLFYHALKMNARNLLRGRKRELKRYESLDGLVSSARADHALATDSDTSEALEGINFPSPRMEDQDPMEILLARQDQRELADEMDYALRVVRCEGNRWITKKDWWKNSTIGQWEKRHRRTELGGSGE